MCINDFQAGGIIGFLFGMVEGVLTIFALFIFNRFSKKKVEV